MDSWRRLTRKGNDIGVPGNNSASTVTWTQSSDPSIQKPPLIPHKSLLNSSDVEASTEDGELALKVFKSRYVPSACTSNWLQSPHPVLQRRCHPQVLESPRAEGRRLPTCRPSPTLCKTRRPSHSPTLITSTKA